MNRIEKNHCIEIGYIQKPHGLNGNVILIFNAEFKVTLEEIKYLLIEVEGGVVPFFIEEEGLRFRGDESAVCSLLFAGSLAKAKELSGCKVYVFDHEIVSIDDSGDTSSLIGMKVFDATFGEVGVITRTDDFSGNLVITVYRQNTEILIPLSGDTVNFVDEVKREIHMKCPDGLIQMYLE
jgi:16S rRNA processing protein RimM